ncbi:MAG: hypothetical protein GY795_27040 [Desulfobacterales bacterium]|nr:hypothetical protein [Desulfobacterales bacterium]
MNYPIILKSKASRGYEAEPMGIPELRIIGATEADAIQKVTQALKEWFSSAKVIQIDIPDMQSSNPWLEAWGRSADDPDFDDFLDEIKQLRTEMQYND